MGDTANVMVSVSVDCGDGHAVAVSVNESVDTGEGIAVDVNVRLSVERGEGSGVELRVSESVETGVGSGLDEGEAVIVWGRTVIVLVTEKDRVPDEDIDGERVSDASIVPDGVAEEDEEGLADNDGADGVLIADRVTDVVKEKHDDGEFVNDSDTVLQGDGVVVDEPECVLLLSDEIVAVCVNAVGEYMIVNVRSTEKEDDDDRDMESDDVLESVIVGVLWEACGGGG